MRPPHWWNITDALTHSQRFDGALTRNCVSFMFEVFDRTIGRDLGPREGKIEAAPHVC